MEREIDSLGIGNTDGTYFEIENHNIKIDFSDNGLYVFSPAINVSSLTIKTDATRIGRLAAGRAVNIPTTVRKEPGFRSTASPSISGGASRPGEGGYTYRAVSLESSNVIGELAMAEIRAGWKWAGRGYPYFICLEQESYKLPFSKLYAAENRQNRMSFDSPSAHFLFNKRWQFMECF